MYYIERKFVFRVIHMMSYCGIMCDKCEAFIATQMKDNVELEKVAKKWSNDVLKLKSEDVICDGCHGNKKIFMWCKECPIRICCREKNLENCAYCESYPCNKLNPSFKNDPANKQRLDEIKEKL